jgi:two-component system CheB/CheR fusion protein
MVVLDYNLTGGITGLQVLARLREIVGHDLPALILTGDISAVTLHNNVLQNCAYLSKPAKLEELEQAIQRLLAIPHSVPDSGVVMNQPC